MTTSQPRNKYFYIGFVTGLINSTTAELTEAQKEVAEDLIKYLNEQS